MVRLMCLCIMWIGWWRTSFPRHFCVRATLGNKKAGLGILPFQAIGLDPEDPFAHEKWGPLPVWKLLFQQIQWHGMQVFTKLQAFMHWVLWKTLHRLLIQYSLRFFFFLMPGNFSQSLKKKKRRGNSLKRIWRRFLINKWDKIKEVKIASQHMHF